MADDDGWTTVGCAPIVVSPEEKLKRDLREARIRRMVEVINALPCKPFTGKRKVLLSTEDMLAMAIGAINKATPETLHKARSVLQRIKPGSPVWGGIARYMVRAAAGTDKRDSTGYVGMFAELVAEVNRPDLVRALQGAMNDMEVVEFTPAAQGTQEWYEQGAKAAAALNTMVFAAALYKFGAFAGGSARLVAYTQQLFQNVRALAALPQTEAIHVSISALQRVIDMMVPKDAAPVVEHVRTWLKTYNPAAPDCKGMNTRARFNLERIVLDADKDKRVTSRVEKILARVLPPIALPAAGAGIVESAAGSNVIDK